MLPTFCVTVSPNFSQIDISVIEINSVLGIGVSLSIYIYIYMNLMYYEGSGFMLNKIFSIQAWPTRFYAVDETKIADLLLTGVLSC